MRCSLLLLSLLLAPVPALAGGGGAPPVFSASQTARPLWTTAVDPGSGIESAGYFGVFAVQNGHAVALDHVTGRVRWRSAADDLAGTPLQRHPLVFFSKKGGAVTALDFLTGKERWTVGGGDGPVRLAPGPSLDATHSAVLAFGDHIALALDQQTGQFLWRVDAVSVEHTVLPVETDSGPTLILHSPSEGFLGNGYTAHDPRTGRELWHLRAGNGYLLGRDGQGLVFDLRDSYNELGPGGTVRAGFVDPQTGKLTRGTLRVGVPNEREWQIEPGTLRLDGAGGTWALVVRVRDGTVRLIHTPAKGRARIWTLPGEGIQVGSGLRLSLSVQGVLAALPDGTVVHIDPGTGRQRTLARVAGGGVRLWDRISGLVLLAGEGETVILDDALHIRLRVPGRADAWAFGGDLQTVMMLRGTRLSGYAWPPFADSLRRSR